MEQTAVDKWWKKKKVVWIGAGVLVLAVAALVIIFYFYGKSNTTERPGGPPDRSGMGENTVTATGLTKTGTTDVEYEFTFLETSLYVEEAYLSAGDEVTEHTPAFSVEEESLEAARRELEKAEIEAELSYRKGVTDYEEGKLEAEETLKLSAVEAQYAQAVYESNLTAAAETVETLTASVEEQSELVAEYQKVVDSNYYYEFYEVEELTERYYEYFTYLMEVYEAWDVEGLYDQYPNGATTTNAAAGMAMETSMTQGEGKSGGNQPSGGSGGASSSGNEEAGKLTAYEYFETLVDNYATKYKEAVENYETQTSLAAASLDQAKIELDALQADLTDAQLEYEKNKITYQKDYDTTLAEAENAQLTYETKMKELEEAFAALEDDYEEAKERKELFETTFGDGVFYTQSAGTVILNQVKAGSYLGDMPVLFSYSNPGSVTVAASVSQEDIASIRVGDSASVSVSEYGEFEGTVISMEPIAASGSRSSVTYTVNVELSGAVETLESNLTASVIFGTTKEEQGNEEKNITEAEG